MYFYTVHYNIILPKMIYFSFRCLFLNLDKKERKRICEIYSLSAKTNIQLYNNETN